MALLVAAGAGAAIWRNRPVETPKPAAAATFVGGQVCSACHQAEAERWRGSHHDLAMQAADASTVLGDFGHATFTAYGVRSTFFTRDGNFLVRTEGPDGKPHEYEIAYTFGITPLQQYLIAFPGGRYQALGIAWDSRPRESGGQRWFHLYPDERIPSDDPLHWTRPAQNWNHMCAECHSTNLRKGYRAAEDRFETTWSELDVSCEACHGPGSSHVAWARQAAGKGSRSSYGPTGLLVSLRRDDSAWVIDQGGRTARRKAPLASSVQVETCARCHSRRGIIHDDYVHGRPLLDTHRPVLLEAGLYHADGQIQDEVYEYGSFLQSKMFRAGVTCSDCHDPHSLRLRAPGNALCARCHDAGAFDSPAHHLHRADSPGSRCVACHMPAKTYMVVDPRADHSLRVPRPDLSAKLGTPNACTGCHRDRPAQWAAEALARRHGPARAPHYAEALAAGRRSSPGAERGLVEVARDEANPAIVRATAISLLRRYPGPAILAELERAAASPEPLIRLAAAMALEGQDPGSWLRLAAPLLGDPVRAVRIEAARILAGSQGQGMTPEQRSAFGRALAEYRHSLDINADRPEAQLGLGLLHQQQGPPDAAERAYEAAIRIDPSFLPAYVNLADFYRMRGREEDGERILRRGLAVEPKAPALRHALGLHLVRQKRLTEAVEELGRAASLGPEEPRYAYVYGVALHSMGRADRALEVLRLAHERHPGDREVLLALATISRDRGQRQAAISYARKLVALAPWDEGARGLLAELQAPRR